MVLNVSAKFYLTISCVLLLSGCNNNIKESIEYKTLLNENYKLKNENDSLKNTLENRFFLAKKMSENKKYKEAILNYEYIILNYKDGYYFDKAKKNLANVKYVVNSLKKEEERRNRLKFKALKPSLNIKTDSLKIKVSNLKFSNSFTFDRYSDTYHYREAERGNKYLSFNANISAENKNPKLPLFYVYVYENSKLNLISSTSGMKYEFYRWEDYGSYLGNEADYSNDFRRSKTVRFAIGEELIVNDYKDKEVYLVLSKKNFAYKTPTRIGNPEIEYAPFTTNKSIPKEIIELDEFDENFYLISRL